MWKWFLLILLLSPFQANATPIFCTSWDGTFKSCTPSGLDKCDSQFVTLSTTFKKYGSHGAYNSSTTDGYMIYRNSGGASFFPGSTSLTGTISVWYHHLGDTNARIVAIGYGALCDASSISKNLVRARLSGVSIYLEIRDDSGSNIISTFGTHGMSSGNWYHIEIDWDVFVGNSRLFVNGVQKVYNAATGSRSELTNPTNIVNFLGAPGTSLQGAVDDAYIVDTVTHTGGFTPPGAALCECVSRMLNFGRPFGSSLGGGFGH